MYIYFSFAQEFEIDLKIKEPVRGELNASVSEQL